ncbi:MAG: hypothetical protein SW833_22450 [Cyanobacteriota bacterium]|nr:hypothetical protein [Cyanobacteriota bacterium]
MKRNLKNLLSNFSWPWWFPYPSSWLRTFILVPIAFPLNALIIVGTVGIIISASQRRFIIFIIATVFTIILPTLIFSFIYHIGWYKWQRQASPKTRAGWFPKGNSLWQGLAATLVMMFSFTTLFTLFLSLILLGCKLSSVPDTGQDVAECASRSLGRIAGAIARQTSSVWDLEGEGVFVQQREQIDARPWFFLWVIIAAYFYQGEYGIRKTLIPFLQKKRRERQQMARQKQKSTPNIDPVDVELARLRGDMGLTSVRQTTARSIPRTKGWRTPRRARLLLVVGLSVAAFTSAIAFYIGWQSLFQPQPTAAPVPAISPSPAAPIPQPEPFPEAVKAATQAAQLAQTAKTPPEWQLVAQQWQTAATLMKSVPSSSPQFNLARQKAMEYEKNLQYAKANAARGR